MKWSLKLCQMANIPMWLCQFDLKNNFQEGSYIIDVVFKPVQNANYSIHSYVNENEKTRDTFFSKYGQLEI